MSTFQVISILKMSCTQKQLKWGLFGIFTIFYNFFVLWGVRGILVIYTRPHFNLDDVLNYYAF